MTTTTTMNTLTRWTPHINMTKKNTRSIRRMKMISEMTSSHLPEAHRSSTPMNKRTTRKITLLHLQEKLLRCVTTVKTSKMKGQSREPEHTKELTQSRNHSPTLLISQSLSPCRLATWQTCCRWLDGCNCAIKSSKWECCTSQDANGSGKMSV